MTGTRPGPRGTELRLALAMRGGVSLAVWMGGACCEVAKLREAAPNAPGTRARGPDVYRTLLDTGGYRTVDIDVLSGTSAGGLNGVLLACHLVYGMPFDHGVRDVWLRLGDLEDLLRRPAPRPSAWPGAERLVRLLSDPAGVTGPDPLPVPCGPGPLAQLDRSGGRAPALFARLREAAPDLAPTPYSSPLALARAVRLLMDWVVAYEDDDTRDEHRSAIAARRELLYAYRFAVSTLTAARDRLLLTAYAEALEGGRVPGDPPGPLGPHALATARLRTAIPEVPADGEPAEVWYRWARDLAARVTEEPQPAPATGTGAGMGADPGPYQELLDRISRLGRTIGTALVPAPAGFQALGEAALLGADEMRAALTDAEVILGPLRPDPQSEATDISFHTVSAANDSWAADRVMGPLRTPQDTVHGKLSGNHLGNFAAFLSVRRRLSDWIWGRLDTAASLVSVAATDERLEHAFGGFTGLPDLRERVARLGPCPRFAVLWADSLRLRPRMCPWGRVRYVLTAVRQREILDEELPLLTALHREGPTSGNRPRDIPRAQSFLEPDLDAPGALKKGLDALGEVAAGSTGS